MYKVHIGQRPINGSEIEILDPYHHHLSNTKGNTEPEQSQLKTSEAASPHAILPYPGQHRAQRRHKASAATPPTQRLPPPSPSPQQDLPSTSRAQPSQESVTALLHPPRGVVGIALSGQRGTSGEGARLLICERVVGGEQGTDSSSGGRGNEALRGEMLLWEMERGEGAGASPDNLPDLTDESGYMESLDAWSHWIRGAKIGRTYLVAGAAKDLKAVGRAVHRKQSIVMSRLKTSVKRNWTSLTRKAGDGDGGMRDVVRDGGLKIELRRRSARTTSDFFSPPDDARAHLQFSISAQLVQ
ncbi:hypothetical protein ASPNIDRAFT_44205 [Aspergillus niger ATCC 1015]|uniref:Uncharacterized protein n=1 Tax=Aspergillus niger (strain ATCC 1015 / CBS 113.46 / FGSC A1144 / LSHB Ac4 / NCTC 3858a / NRRL 328 / USDA 3528.7) TaxID=380704 RepID=G3Y8M0_ASPNA|nr:hypothetical protein ASPNIDRAFT_44205 [Aspergillus niger ATCC 1015]